MKSNSEIYDSVKSKAAKYERKKKQKRKALISAVSVCLVVAITLGVTLPLLPKGDGGDYLNSFVSSITVDVNNAVGGYDSAIWDNELNVWKNEYVYDSDLSAYPASITRRLAYTMDTNRDSYFWIKINVLGYYIDKYVRDVFVDTLKKQNVSTERTQVLYTYAEDTEDRKDAVCGVIGLWTREEILNFAIAYTKVYDSPIRETGPNSYYVGIAINLTPDPNDIASKYMSEPLYRAVGEVGNDAHFAVYLEYEFPIGSSNVYDAWSLYVETAKNLYSTLPKSNLQDYVIIQFGLTTTARYDKVRVVEWGSTVTKYYDNDCSTKKWLNATDFKVSDEQIQARKHWQGEFKPYSKSRNEYLFNYASALGPLQKVKDDLLAELSDMTERVFGEGPSASRWYTEDFNFRGFEDRARYLVFTVMTKLQLEALCKLSKQTQYLVSINSANKYLDTFADGVLEQCVRVVDEEQVDPTEN